MSGPYDSAPSPSVRLGEPAEGGGSAERGEPEGERYVELALLGAGGMGEVHAVYDATLGRQVARKQPRLDVEGAAAALAHEAAVTAALEHPGIVPVYDLGRDAAGRPWYTMRMVRGRQLRTVIAEERSLSRRLGLLRAFLSAVEAVAYAHQRGVVHCDLKTQNILIGEHGEVQVVDWGLAADRAAAASGGTLATMAPEQARGESVSCASDVWALGMALRELLGGEPAHEGVEEQALLRLVRNGQAPPPLQAPVPAALRAIVQRCLRADPAERYPDAGELAADLARFLDGQLVQAHDYTLAEQVRLFVAAHRAAVVALVVVLVVSAWAAVRVVAERDVARDAAARTQVALDRSDQHLALTLVLAARTAAARGSRAEAEVLAAGALGLRESPEARGVLAAFAASARPRREAWPVPACAGQLRAAPEGTACIEADALTVRFVDGRSWRVPLAAVDVAFAGEHVVATVRRNTAVFLDGADGHERGRVEDIPGERGLISGRSAAWMAANDAITRLDAASGLVTRSPVCGDDVVVSAAEGDGLVVACGVDELKRVEAGGLVPLPYRLRDERAAFRKLVAGPDGSVAVGTDRGQVVVIDGGGERFVAEIGSAVADLWWTGDGARLVASTLTGEHVVLHARTGAPLGRLPALAGPIVGRVGASDLVLAGDGGTRWQVGELRPVRVGSGGGITGVVHGWLHDVVVTRGDGAVERWDLSTGALLRRDAAGLRPMKAVARRPGGAGFGAVGVDAGVRLYDAELVRSAVSEGDLGRRLVPFGGELLLVSYSRPPLLVSPVDGRVRGLFDGDAGTIWDDVGADEQGLFVAGLDEDAGLWWASAGGEVLHLGSWPEARCVDVAPDGAALLVLGGELVEVQRSGSAERRPLPGGELALDLAVSPGGLLVATGDLRGVVRVHERSSGALLAVLEGHDERAVSLWWSSETELTSASWDGTVRLWDLTDLRTPPAQIAAEVEAAWGLGVADALTVIRP